MAPILPPQKRWFLLQWLIPAVKTVRLASKALTCSAVIPLLGKGSWKDDEVGEFFPSPFLWQIRNFFPIKSVSFSKSFQLPFPTTRRPGLLLVAMVESSLAQMLWRLALNDLDPKFVWFRSSKFSLENASSFSGVIYKNRFQLHLLLVINS